MWRYTFSRTILDVTLVTWIAATHPIYIQVGVLATHLNHHEYRNLVMELLRKSGRDVIDVRSDYYLVGSFFP